MVKKGIFKMGGAMIIATMMLTGCTGNIASDIASEIISDKESDNNDSANIENTAVLDETSDVEESTDSSEISDSLGLLEEKSITPYFFNGTGEYNYDVVQFFEEDIDEVPVKVELMASLLKGDIYSVDIKYDTIDQRIYMDSVDRYNIGYFYVTSDSIYFIDLTQDIDYEDEQQFVDNGILVCSDTDSDQIINDQEIIIENDEDTCLCRIFSTVGESNMYYNFGFTKGKGLTFFRSGYGAEGDPIEISLQ